jgi:hypothetical protein
MRCGVPQRAPILIPFLVIGGLFFAVERNGFIAEWRAIYPTDRGKKAALHLCYIENHQFNRLSDQARKGRYEKWLRRLQAGPAKMVTLHG